MQGRIVTVRVDKNFCFVRSPDVPQDVFLHGSQLLLEEGVEFSADLKGREVDFELQQVERGPQARQARLVQEW